MDFTTLHAALDYTFRDPALVELALTHSSWANEHGLNAHNERLEFLGDAVLELCISDAIYSRMTTSREGDMTRLRSQLVNATVLAELARAIGLDGMLRLGKGEEQQGGRQRDALLADAMEAVLGGVFLDGGFAAAHSVVTRLFADRWKAVRPTERKDFKSRLQEITQQILRTLPVYTLMGSTGPEHDRLFTVAVSLSDGRQWSAQASSVKRAEHEAAHLALSALVAPQTTDNRTPDCTSEHS